MFEIELKAWVDDSDAVKKRISALAEFTADFEKEDIYWIPVSRPESPPAAPLSSVRIRKETLKPQGKEPEHLILVTYKVKELRSCIEVNDEKEFAVTAPSDTDAARKASLNAFEGLLYRLGLKAGVSKKKQGTAWKYAAGIGDGSDCGRDPIYVELSRVDRLGVFVEVEILTYSNDSETVNTARDRLMALLKLIGISADKIETRYYNDMLANLPPLE
ncbi:MAG: CYTH domain-containing protein [Spirochaetaceae bacterium]|nr:CYTH domain-containing protein [Spirochaetaceae bacterium]